MSLDDRRADAKERNLKRRRIKGCFEPLERGGQKVLDLYQYRLCPGNFYDQSAIFLIRLYQQFEKGVLPFAGSLADQPNKVMEAFRLIEMYKSDKLEKDIQKQKLRENATRGRGGR